MNYVLLFGMPGGGELIFIVFIILLLFGSKKIPELARGLGKGMREFKNATNEIQQEIKEGVREIDNAKKFTNVEKQVDNILNDSEKDASSKQNTENKSEMKDTKTTNDSENTSPTENTTTINPPKQQTIQRDNSYSSTNPKTSSK